MKNYKITIQYDGTRYNGWQRLGNTQNTIQGKIEDVLSRMVGHSVEIHGSGRTDKGVHACGQVANFKINTEFSASEIKDYLNRYLPEDIAVIDACEVHERFHSRLCVKSKTYIYRIWNSDVPDVFRHKYMYTVEDKLDFDAMKKTAEYMLGTHDFSGFSSLKKHKKSTVRTIYKLTVDKQNDEIIITVKGNGFLYNMVRIISGTILEAGLGLRTPESVLEIFESKTREMAGKTLPAKGLMLLEVDYGED